MARITIRSLETHVGSVSDLEGDVLVVPLSEGTTTLPGWADALFPGELHPVRVLFGSGDFRAKLAETQTAYVGEGRVSRVMLLGLGDEKGWTRERLRVAVASAARRALELAARSVIFPLPVPLGSDPALAQLETATEAAFLGTYRFDAPKKANESDERALDSVVFQLPGDIEPGAAEAAAARGRDRAHGTNLARDLGNAPANLMTPTDLARHAATLAETHGLELTVLERADAERLGMGAFLGVTQGSAQPPKMILLRYDCGDPKAPTVGLVGKGITFDSGGISLKPSAKMEDMKYDMCGAATVLGVMSAVRPLGIPVHVVAAVAAAENMPSSTATKPGDVHTSYSGKTIEVQNTDAEGRLVLADALTYVVRNYQPAAVMDFATLTGAVIVALGHYGAGVLSNDDDLWRRVEAAADSSGDRAWRLPIWEEMPEHLQTPFADLKNIADGNAGAGTIAAGAFLREFVEETPWAHIDIAGTAWWDKERPHLPKGATGFGVRLALDTLESWGR